MTRLFTQEAIPKNEKVEWEPESEDESYSETTSDCEQGSRSFIVSTLTDKYVTMLGDIRSKQLRAMVSEPFDFYESIYFGDLLCQEVEKGFTQVVETNVHKIGEEMFGSDQDVGLNEERVDKV